MSNKLLPLEQVQQWILQNCKTLEPVYKPLAECLGLVSAQDLYSNEDIPSFDNTAMDGYAVKASDISTIPTELEVVATIGAGSYPNFILEPHQAARIMTGAPIPQGSDAVVQRENTIEKEQSVVIQSLPKAGDNIRYIGEDIKKGQEVFPKGTVLSPGHLGVLASIGIEQIKVFPRVRVGVLSSGDELVESGSAIEVGQIRDSNRKTLIGLLQQASFEPVDLGLVKDNEVAIAAAIESGISRCDALITSGGVSVGDFDYVKTVLDKLANGTMRWMQIAIKPAKPLAFGLVDNKPVFGLPGNPVSSMVSFELFARPSFKKMSGHDPNSLHRIKLSGIAQENLYRKSDGKLHLMRVIVSYEDKVFKVTPTQGQSSHLLRSMALSNALALVPDGKGIKAGQEVEVILLSQLEA